MATTTATTPKPATAATATSAILPRDLDVELAAIPRNWLAGNAAATAIANGVNLLFPAGERFFVRSVKHYLDQIDDPQLRADIKGFFGQEGRHAREHDRFNAVMTAQGYEIAAFLARYERLSGWIEKLSSPALRLATTAACEHFTAILAEGAFRGSVLDRAAPGMQALLSWHAAEEIEHKAVAFDVLKTVDPRYSTRIAGLAMATLTLGGFWIAAAVMLMRQDGLSVRGALRDVRSQNGQDPIVMRVFGRGIREYLRRDFHPNDRDTSQLAAAWMAAHGIAMPAPARGAA